MTRIWRKSCLRTIVWFLTIHRQQRKENWDSDDSKDFDKNYKNMINHEDSRRACLKIWYSGLCPHWSVKCKRNICISTIAYRRTIFYLDWQRNKHTHWFLSQMPIVCGLIVPELGFITYDGNIRRLELESFAIMTIV